MVIAPPKRLHTLVRSLPVLAASPWGLVAPNAPAATVEVTVRNFQFDPPAVTVRPGDTVRWNFATGGHTVTMGTCGRPSGMFDSGLVPAGGTASFTFTRAGTFPYICQPHCSIGMTGTVTVAGGASPGAGGKPPVLKLTVTGQRKPVHKIQEGETIAIKAVGFDRDGDPVTLDASGLPPGAQWTPASGKRAEGTFTWTPGPGAAAAQPVVTIVFSATDNPANGSAPLTTTQTVTLAVGQNAAPQLEPIQPPEVRVGKRLRLTVRAFDPDGDRLRFFAEGLPQGAKLKRMARVRGAWTAALIWRPTADQAGQSFPVTVTVQDDAPNPAQDSRELVLTVLPR